MKEVELDMEDKYIQQYINEIERLQLKGGDLTPQEIQVLDYCNEMLHDYGQRYLNWRSTHSHKEDFSILFFQS